VEFSALDTSRIATSLRRGSARSDPEVTGTPGAETEGSLRRKTFTGGLDGSVASASAAGPVTFPTPVVNGTTGRASAATTIPVAAADVALMCRTAMSAYRPATRGP
jgi:hypothetical protein